MNPNIGECLGHANSGLDIPSYRSREVVDSAHELLEHHPHFRAHAKEITVELRDGKMVLSGQLPSFYLKQLLQECLRKIDAVSEIDNRVDVVNCHGLSSGPHKAR